MCLTLKQNCMCFVLSFDISRTLHTCSYSHGTKINISEFSNDCLEVQTNTTRTNTRAKTRNSQPKFGPCPCMSFHVLHKAFLCPFMSAECLPCVRSYPPHASSVAPRLAAMSFHVSSCPSFGSSCEFRARPLSIFVYIYIYICIYVYEMSLRNRAGELC